MDSIPLPSSYAGNACKVETIAPGRPATMSTRESNA
jgi:hypothetical protein